MPFPRTQDGFQSDNRLASREWELLLLDAYSVHLGFRTQAIKEIHLEAFGTICP